MSNWMCSDVTHMQLESLARRGMLPKLAEAEEWKKPGLEDNPQVPKGYVVSLVAFHEHGFSVPASRFFRGLLSEYEIELQHLNPNGIQQMATFVALYEGYLGIEAHWELFRYFFKFAVQHDENKAPATIGCAGLKMKQGRSREYIPFTLPSSNKGWHSGWFYLKNDAALPLPEYSGRSIATAHHSWAYGPGDREKTRLQDAFDAIAKLRAGGVTTTGIIGGYHSRGVMPLMERALLICEMTVDQAPFARTVSVETLPSTEEVRRRVASAVGK